MAYWFILLLLQPGLSTKILTFEDSSEGDIAHDIIDRSTPLPDTFTLCLVQKEDLIHFQNCFFTIYGESGESWMTMDNFASDHVFLLLTINKSITQITVIPEHLMNTWIHICIEADTISGNISVLVNNGPPLFFTVPELIKQKPENLKGKLYIGQAESHQGPKQYQGEVANFNIFSGSKEVKNLIVESCKHEGDIVNKDTEWKRIGVVKERTEDSWKICNNNDIYRVAIPEKTTWDTARDLCEKLGGGNITEPRSERDMMDVTSSLQKMNSSCTYVWTSISDEDQEGEFRSSITGKIITFQPWFGGQPNGKEEENHVRFGVKSKQWFDIHKSLKCCLACDLHKTLTVTLIGGCEDTSFGEQMFFKGEGC